MIKLFYSLIVLFLVSISPVFAQGDNQTHTRVRLVSEQDAIVPGSTFWVGIDFILDDGWHIYWQNPGDSGLTPKIKWQKYQLASGVRIGDVHWPYPVRINVGPLTSFGYEHEVFLLVPVSVDGNLQSTQEVNLQARVDWLACQDICVPGKAQLNLSLPVLNKITRNSYNNFKKSFDQVRLNWPLSIPSMRAHTSLEADEWHINIQSSIKGADDIVFYPFRNDVIEHAATQMTQVTSNGYELILKKSHISQGSLKSLDGIAINPSGWVKNGKVKAIIIHAPIEQDRPVPVPFLLACLFALIGGLILNLMPCVLPVLSIKVFHLVERHPDRRIAVGHSLTYALGVLVSVWSLAFLLFILKSAGEFAGWGFQFQSPIFVIIVAVILFVLALNLFGVFEFSSPAINGLPSYQGGFQASFISGVITTIVASPCTAPFMGTALTVALAQPNIVGFGIFTSLGVGLALPFVLLSAFPSMLSFVPKPGPWMIYLKKFFGIILLVCVFWLLWVFSLQTGWGDLSKFYKSSNETHWQAYSSTAVSQARQSGHGVFLDFTAAWCINCQVNDRLVLQNADVVRAFKDQGIIAIKGDWTKYDPAITQALASFGRDSIPVYVYYPPGAGDPIILPQLITPKSVLESIGHIEHK